MKPSARRESIDSGIRVILIRNMYVSNCHIQCETVNRMPRDFSGTVMTYAYKFYLAISHRKKFLIRTIFLILDLKYLLDN